MEILISAFAGSLCIIGMIIGSKIADKGAPMNFNPDEKQDYEGFVCHIQTWDKENLPYGTEDLRKLAHRYNVPVPNQYLQGRSHE